jgi:hypothetical protein
MLRKRHETGVQESHLCQYLYFCTSKTSKAPHATHAEAPLFFFCNAAPGDRGVHASAPSVSPVSRQRCAGDQKATEVCTRAPSVSLFDLLLTSVSTQSVSLFFFPLSPVPVSTACIKKKRAWQRRRAPSRPAARCSSCISHSGTRGQGGGAEGATAAAARAPTPAARAPRR